MKWIAVFSHTGREIVELSNAIGKKPDMVLTDNTSALSWDPHMHVNDFCIAIPFGGKPVDSINRYLRAENNAKALITLHGYMRIIPADICEARTVYNGHPALINYFSDLAGKDPQEKTWDNIASYPFLGSVVHRVTRTVDDPTTVTDYALVNNTCTDKKELYNILRDTSLLAWKQFMRNYERRN